MPAFGFTVITTPLPTVVFVAISAGFTIDIERFGQDDDGTWELI